MMLNKINKVRNYLYVLLLGLILRFVSINQSFWLDEATSALTVRDLDLTEIFTRFLPSDFHPPLYYLFLKWWSSVFGVSEISLRSMSIFFGMLTIILTYKLAILLFKDKKIAFLAATLLATSGLHIYYSQEARMYSLAAFLVTASVYYFGKIFFDSARIGEWAVFSLSLALVFITDYLAVSIIGVFWLFVIIFRKTKNWYVNLLAAHIPLIIMFLFWFKHLSAQIGVGLQTKIVNPMWWDVLGKASVKNVVLVWIKFVLGRISFFDKNFYYSIIIITSIIFLIPLVAPIFKGVASKAKQYYLLVIWLTVPIVFITAISIKVPVLAYFRLLFLLPAFYLLLAKGVYVLGKHKRFFATLLIFVNIVSASYYLLNPKMHREDWRGFAKEVQESSQERFRVVFPSLNNQEGFVYYFGAENVSGSLVLLTNYQTIWLVRYLYTFYDIDDTLKNRVESAGFSKIQELDFNGVVVWKYER